MSRAGPALIWFTALALAVAGPLLGGGYLLLLDYPSGPEAPDFSWFPVPSSGDLGNATPMLAVQTLLREIWSLLPDKLFLLAPISRHRDLRSADARCRSASRLFRLGAGRSGSGSGRHARRPRS